MDEVNMLTTLEKLRLAFQQEDFSAFDAIASELEKLGALNSIPLPKNWKANPGYAQGLPPDLEEGDYISFLYRNLSMAAGEANIYSWGLTGNDYDIIAYSKGG
jgi:hypothetical protein